MHHRRSTIHFFGGSKPPGPPYSSLTLHYVSRKVPKIITCMNIDYIYKFRYHTIKYHLSLFFYTEKYGCNNVDNYAFCSNWARKYLLISITYMYTRQCPSTAWIPTLAQSLWYMYMPGIQFFVRQIIPFFYY